jgi:hypothetical protein
MKKIYLFVFLLSLLYSSNIYSQCISGDCQNGKGTMIYSDGSRYEGNWSNGKCNGFGIETYSNGNRYEGNFINDLRSGKAKSFFANGDLYEGDYFDNSRNGYGKLTCSNGIRYEGNWSNSKKNGFGVQIWPNGDRYEGNWLDDKQNGQGRYYWVNGSLYDGEFDDDNRTGFGKLTKKDGTIQDGEFLNNVFQGTELSETKGQNNTQTNTQTNSNPSNSATNKSNGSVSNYTFTKAPELKINYIDNRKMCCCCNQTYSQYKLRENIITEEKIHYLTEKLAIFHQQNGNALLSETRNEAQVQNDLANLKAFLEKTYPGNDLLIILTDMYHLSIISGLTIFNKTQPGSTERFVDKYEITSPYCSLRCKNDERCTSCP